MIVRDFTRGFGLAAIVAEGPWRAVFAAALFGAWLGSAPTRRELDRERRQHRTLLADVFGGTFATVALRLARRAALNQARLIARELSVAAAQHVAASSR
ncbi:MAG TPA: hypothetical protein VLX92_03445 [Kofleriaceae bacterium]|nr:hypothetical protein [Kofleriaceae bacterium]